MFTIMTNSGTSYNVENWDQYSELLISFTYNGQSYFIPVTTIQYIQRLS